MSRKRNYVLFKLSRRRYGDVGADYKWYPSYYSRGGLIHRIALTYDKDYFILNNMSKDMSETECGTHWVGNKNIFGGGYFREDNLYFLAKIDGNALKTIKADDIIDEVIVEVTRLEIKKNKRSKAREAERRMENSYEFRRDPVPNVHNYNNCHRGDTYRHPATTKTKRNNFYEDEYVKINSPKIRNLPNVYDDIIRHRDKSWKTSCKIKKQWQKHVRKHVGTLDYNKRAFDAEVVDEM